MEDIALALKHILREDRLIIERLGREPETIQNPVELRADVSRGEYATSMQAFINTFRSLRGSHSHIPDFVALLTDEDATVSDDEDRPIKPFRPPFRWRSGATRREKNVFADLVSSRLRGSRLVSEKA